MSKTIVLKFGGSNFHGEALQPFADAVARVVQGGTQLVVVHGGGKDLSTLLTQLGQTPRFVDGLRVTDEATLDAAELVLSGRVNKRITRALQRAGVKAVGIAGTDGGLLTASVRRGVAKGPDGQLVELDWGRVGDVTAVDTHLLTTLAAAGYVPVVSPLALGPDGDALNVNADTAAAALAAALGAELRLVTDVPGIRAKPDGEPLAVVTAAGVQAMKAGGVIRDGMVPKVDACLSAIRAGAHGAFIQSLAGFIAGTPGGTRVVEADA